MSQGASNYPISQLITRIMDDSGFSCIEFLTSLRYRNLERGLRRLDPWIEKGEGFDLIIKQIATFYPIYAGEIQTAVAATKEMKAAEAEASWIESLKAEAGTFRPYIHVEGESTIPSGISMFGMTGGRWNLIPVPEALLELAMDQQLGALAELMRGYLKEYRGSCPFFGKVTGFRFVRLLDYLQFDKEGQFIELVNKPFRRAHCSVSIG